MNEEGQGQTGTVGTDDNMAFPLSTVTVTVNESVRFIGPGGIIQTVIRLGIWQPDFDPFKSPHW